MKRIKILIAVALMLTVNTYGQNYLSHLSADSSSPIYTTYAANMKRSNFVVDEGYQFVWFKDNDGINFEGSRAGNICLAFKLNGTVHYYLNQYYRQPVITTSYNDLVKYYFYPFQGVRVNATFLVYSSRIAVQDITITNETGSQIAMSIYPFYYREKDGVTNASISLAHEGFIFQHIETPDGWTTSHNILFQQNLKDVYLMDTTFDSYGGYEDLGSISPKLKKLEGTNYAVEWGTVRHQDGSACDHSPPSAQQVIFHNGKENEILTEDAPKWGDTEPNIPGNGYQGCELGNFSNPSIAVGDSFSVIFTCLSTNEQGKGTGKILQLPSPDGIQTNIKLFSDSFPAIPDSVTIQFSQTKASSFISWNRVAGNIYYLYRRTSSMKGKYELVADSIDASGYLDSGLNPDTSYGYVLLAKDSSGKFSGHSIEAGDINSAPKYFFTDILNQSLQDEISQNSVKVLAMEKSITIPAGSSLHFRIIRGVVEDTSNLDNFTSKCRALKNVNLNEFVNDDQLEYSKIPRLNFTEPDYEMFYWQCFDLLRQCMLPPEGKCSYNYYVFSREPQWGWGHGGQVFHESLSMLAYVYMDAESAMNSQRVYVERQHSDGYINYRTGPYLDETIPASRKLTSSGPFYNYENWEIYKVSKDTSFLRVAYQSGKKFYNWWLKNRDSNNDGLAEWGASAVLESLRDGQVAVWDQVGSPQNFDCLDLNCMLVKEANSLAQMAKALGKQNDYENWINETDSRKDSINKYMWDSETGFYYNINKDTHSFTFKNTNDLKRKEIIGFLPLWAGIADSAQAAVLVRHLTNPNEFWRKYGIPSLSADDPYYNPQGYWNGPVWVQWQYLIFRGLLHYGYIDIANQLMHKVIDNMIYELKDNHYLWEIYSPDQHWAGWNKTYIWAGIASRMLIDMQKYKPLNVNDHKRIDVPTSFKLFQNYPNPFNPSTVIKYSIPYSTDNSSVKVQLIVYNILGEKIEEPVDNYEHPGEHQIIFNMKEMSSGVYFYQLKVGLPGQVQKFSQTKKMILLR